VSDIGGWDVYGEHWRFFFDCMLAPVAKQVRGPCPYNLRVLQCHAAGALPLCICLRRE